MTAVRVLRDLLLVRDDPDEAQVGRIHLAQTAEIPTTTGVVIGVGPGKRRDKDGKRGDMSGLRPGDRVCFDANLGEFYWYEGEAVRILKYEDIHYTIPA